MKQSPEKPFIGKTFGGIKSDGISDGFSFDMPNDGSIKFGIGHGSDNVEVRGFCLSERLTAELERVRNEQKDNKD